MATNLQLKIVDLESRIKELENLGLKKHEIIHEISRQETTEKTGDLIRKSYDLINSAIQKAQNTGEIGKIHELIGLKKDVPRKYAISRESMNSLNNILNQIVQ